MQNSLQQDSKNKCTWILQFTNNSSTVFLSLSCRPAWCMPIPKASVSFRFESLTVNIMSFICNRKNSCIYKTDYSEVSNFFSLIARIICSMLFTQTGKHRIQSLNSLGLVSKKSNPILMMWGNTKCT